MAHPELVADCFKAMQDAVSIPITIKHRIGINGRETYQDLHQFVETLYQAGCKSFTVHARIAILEGLSPKDNREIPPLQYATAAQLVTDFPEAEFILNGGIKTFSECHNHLATFDGVMLGREAYYNSWMLAQVDSQLFSDRTLVSTRTELLEQLQPYFAAHLAEGEAPQHITRHLLGLAQGFPGARKFRQLLSSDIYKSAQPMQVYEQAMLALNGQ